MLVPSPKWLDTGDNAWQLAAATFVGLQSIPGLVVLYGGIVKKKWAIFMLNLPNINKLSSHFHASNI